MKRIYAAILVAGAVSSAGTASAQAVDRVTYDPTTDELIVTMLYRGTNPDHVFSLSWDECTNHPDGTTDVTAQVLDSQGSDPARQEFTKTVHLSLGGLKCRPATVTLHVGLHSYESLRVPAAP